MQSDIQAILHQAEEHYLNKLEIADFQNSVASVAQRLATYKCLRDHEIEIFQPIAEEIVKAYPEQNPQLLEKVLKQWLAVMRYCAMAMLLNNPEYLERRILEWLGQILQAHQMQLVSKTVYELLLINLEKTLDQKQLVLLQPFLEQTQASLVEEQILSTVGA